jgi:hypothetical protein
MNGISAERIATVSHGTALYIAANTVASPVPMTPPRGPRTHTTIGMQIRQNSIGLRKDLTRFGETLSAKSSTAHMIGAIRAIGSIEEV